MYCPAPKLGWYYLTNIFLGWLHWTARFDVWQQLQSEPGTCRLADESWKPVFWSSLQPEPGGRPAPSEPQDIGLWKRFQPELGGCHLSKWPWDAEVWTTVPAAPWDLGPPELAKLDLGPLWRCALGSCAVSAAPMPGMSRRFAKYWIWRSFRAVNERGMAMVQELLEVVNWLPQVTGTFWGMFSGLGWFPDFGGLVANHSSSQWCRAHVGRWKNSGSSSIGFPVDM